MTTSGPAPVAFEVLLDWVEQRLPAEEAQAVAQIVEADPRSARTVEWMHGFLRVSGELPLEEPPPILRQRLRQHFRAWSRTGRTAGPPQSVAGVLEFDSRTAANLVGVRGRSDTGVDWHLAYRTDPADLVLDVYAQPDQSFRIEGQVLLTHEANAPVFQAQATGPNISIRTVDGDELGRFTIADVPAAVTRLEASNGDLAIVVDLDLVGDKS